MDKSSEENVIKAKKRSDGFSFSVSVSHIIEQTLLRTYNSPDFKKSTIKITDEYDSESECSDDSTESTSNRENNKNKGVPIKLLMKRKYAEDSADSLEGSYENLAQDPDQPLDLVKREKKEKKRKLLQCDTLDKMSAIPPSWIMQGLTNADHKRFQNSIANASLSPYQKRKITKTEAV